MMYIVLKNICVCAVIHSFLSVKMDVDDFTAFNDWYKGSFINEGTLTFDELLVLLYIDPVTSLWSLSVIFFMKGVR